MICDARGVENWELALFQRSNMICASFGLVVRPED